MTGTVLATLLWALQGGLESALAELNAGRPDRVLVALEDAPESAERDALEVRAYLAAGLYREALARARSSATRWSDVRADTALELRFYAAQAGLWLRAGEATLRELQALEDLLRLEPAAVPTETADWYRGIARDYAQQAAELAATRADLAAREARAKRVSLAWAAVLTGALVALVVRR